MQRARDITLLPTQRLTRVESNGYTAMARIFIHFCTATPHLLSSHLHCTALHFFSLVVAVACFFFPPIHSLSLSLRGENM